MASVEERLGARPLYHLHALGAAGAPSINPDVAATEPLGRGLAVLRPWLDHVADLGCGGVLLTPIVVSSTHGYDTADPFRVDQRLGDDSDFAALVDGCHARDLVVLLDGVFNHVGRDFGPFRDVLASGRNSRWADWFRLDFARDDGDGFGYATFEGHRELVALNHRSEAVLEWAGDVTRHWLERGVDGWRLDAAYAVPAAFLAALAERVHTTHPDAFLFGEVIHGDYARFVAESGLDSVTQYELHKAIWSSLNDANPFELAWALGRHREFAADFVPITFVGNHDVTRLATQLSDRDHLAAALAVLLTVPGLPCVYYGDELAWHGRKEQRAGGDDAIRPPLPVDPRPRDECEADALAVHRELIALRRARAWLPGASLEVVEVTNHAITYDVGARDDALRVTIDTTGANPASADGWRIVFARHGATICERA